MRRRAVVRLCTTAAAAAMLAGSASAAFAATGYSGDDDLKTEVCREIGCSNGSLLCGTASGTLLELYWVLDYAIALERSVAWTCYEARSY